MSFIRPGTVANSIKALSGSISYSKKFFLLFTVANLINTLLLCLQFKRWLFHLLILNTHSQERISITFWLKGVKNDTEVSDGF